MFLNFLNFSLNHTEEFFDDEMNEHVCKNLFSKSKKLIVETIEYMDLHKWDTLQAAIYIFSKYGVSREISLIFNQIFSFLYQFQDDIEKLNFLIDTLFAGNSQEVLLKHSFQLVIENKDESISLCIALRIYLTWSLNMMECE